MCLINLYTRVPLYNDSPFQQAHGICQQERLPCFALALAAAASDISEAQLEEMMRRLSPRGGILHLGHWQVPYDQDGMLIIEYVGDRSYFESWSNHVKYDVMRKLNYSPHEFAGKIVIVGASNPTSHDIYPTPYGPMSGMQIHANILATIRAGGFSPLVMPGWMVWSLAWICCLLLLWPLMRWPLWCSFLLLLLECLALVCGAAVWHLYTHTLFHVSIPILAIIFTYNAIALYEYGRMRFTLARFIGPDMLKRTLHYFIHLRLGAGAVEEASALFCDLRGYAALSESLDPAAIASFVTAYTDTVSTLVQRYHGRPIDYAGDGVFVLFETALAGRQHAVRRPAALEVREAFRAGRTQWAARGFPEVELGIAIDTGPMMIGVLGSTYYLKLGAVGDAVNVAARVQQLSRQCGYEVLVTLATYQQVSHTFPADYCGTFALYGRTNPVEVYGIATSRIREPVNSER